VRRLEAGACLLVWAAPTAAAPASRDQPRAKAPYPPADCDGTRARVTTPAPPQGGVVLLEVETEAGEPAATWQGKAVRFWRDDPQGPWRALVGVDLDQRPGETRVLVERGRDGTCAVVLSIKAVAFPEEHLRVPQRFVELSPRDEARAAREAARLAALFRAITTERLWHGPFHLPIEGVQPSSSFGRRRILNGRPRSPHTGVDLGAPAGTPIRAMQRGRVVLDADLFFSGRTVILDHGLGLFSLYGHLSESRVQPGVVVDAGEVIGLVGATGRVTAPHLHWAVRLGDARVDGLDLLIVGDQLAAPALDRRRHLLEAAAPGGQGVLDADGGAGLDVTGDEPARLQLLQPRRERLGPHAAGLLFELAEP
jgi:murein DD-endopeptidase MepM/ murein hydrolase activator NlpD